MRYCLTPKTPDPDLLAKRQRVGVARAEGGVVGIEAGCGITVAIVEWIVADRAQPAGNNTGQLGEKANIPGFVQHVHAFAIMGGTGEITRSVSEQSEVLAAAHRTGDQMSLA